MSHFESALGTLTLGGIFLIILTQVSKAQTVAEIAVEHDHNFALFILFFTTAAAAACAAWLMFKILDRFFTHR